MIWKVQPDADLTPYGGYFNPWTLLIVNDPSDELVTIMVLMSCDQIRVARSDQEHEVTQVDQRIRDEIFLP